MSTTRVTAAAFLGAIALSSASCRTTGPREMGGVVVDIIGEEHVDDADLYDVAARELSSFSRGQERAANASDAAFTMEHHLLDLGYAHANVRFELLPNEEEATELVFHVDEGPRATLRQVDYPGRRTMSDDELRARMQVRFEVDLGATRWYRQSQVEEAVGYVESLYAIRGYHRARVGPAVTTFSEDLTQADVVIPIKEGRRFTISKVVIEGEIPDAVRERLPTVAGEPFYRRVAADTAARVRGLLRDEGYQLATARGRWELDGGGEPTATITVSVEPGKQQVVRSWKVTGLERSDPDFIDGLVKVREGELARQSVLTDAIDALYGTGAFSTVNVRSELAADVDEDPEHPGMEVRDVEFAVEERDARSIEAGGGWGSYEKARGWVGYRDRNFMGLSRIFDVVLRGSTKSAGISSRVTDRYILGPSRTLSIGGRYDRREEPSFDSKTFEGDVTIRQRVDDQHVVFFGYRLRTETADDLDLLRRRFEERRTRAAGFDTGVVHDTRNDRIFPSAGVLADFSVFWSDESLGADLDFIEWSAKWARYFDVGRDAVLAVGLRYTTRDVRDSRVTLPIQERLFLGGETTVRSFKESELGPSDARNDPLGGLTSAMATIELRRPIWRQLDGAVFYDVGTVSEESFDLDKVGAAIGVGLRYRLPIGPVRLDFAYNPNHRFSASDNWALHLSFGFSF